MKKTIIISEAKFKQLTNFLISEDKSMDNAFMRFEKYKELGNDFFKNPNINDEMKAKDSSTYNIALKRKWMMLLKQFIVFSKKYLIIWEQHIQRQQMKTQRMEKKLHTEKQMDASFYILRGGRHCECKKI